MTKKEAIARIKDHMSVHKIYEERAVKITEALNMAISALEQPEIVRCEDCRWGRKVCGNIECFVDSNIPTEYHSYEWFCPNGERRTDEQDMSVMRMNAKPKWMYTKKEEAMLEMEGN